MRIRIFCELYTLHPTFVKLFGNLTFHLEDLLISLTLKKNLNKSFRKLNGNHKLERRCKGEELTLEMELSTTVNNIPNTTTSTPLTLGCKNSLQGSKIVEIVDERNTESVSIMKTVL